jgi:hypothetical protein
MNRRFAAPLVAGAALVLCAASAHAGPCTTAIARFEQAVRQSAGGPERRADGAAIDRRTARSSTDARLGETRRGARPNQLHGHSGPRQAVRATAGEPGAF